MNYVIVFHNNLRWVMGEVEQCSINMFEERQNERHHVFELF